MTGFYFEVVLKLVLFLFLRYSLGLECEYFNSSICGETNYALKNYKSCSFEACSEAYVTVSVDKCVNFPFLRLVSNNGSLLMVAEDSAGECPYLEFFVPKNLACATYEVHVGCNEDSEEHCEGQLSIDIGSLSVDSSDLTSSSGDSWTYTCPAFDLPESNDGFGDTDKAALCAFEACPGHYYSVEMSGCDNSPDAYMDLYSFSESGTFGSGGCTRPLTFMGLEQCQVVSIYQYCWGGACQGHTTITAMAIPTSTATSLSAFEPYSVVALYRTGMLTRVEDCQYFSDYEEDIYSYLYWEIVTDSAVADGATMNSTHMYARSPFGGSFKAVLYYFYRYDDVGLEGVYIAGESPVLTVDGGVVEFSLDDMALGEVVHGSWTSPHPAAEGDYIALFELNAPGHCNRGAWDIEDSYMYDALWYILIPKGSTGGFFNTSAGHGGVPNAFIYQLPLSDCDNRQFEFRYMYLGENQVYPELVGVSDPFEFASSSVTPSSVPTSSAPTSAPTNLSSFASSMLPSSSPSLTSHFYAFSCPHMSSAPTTRFHTNVYFTGQVRIRGISTGDMDIGVTHAFVHVVADCMTEVTTNDIGITRMRDGTTSRRLTNVNESVDIFFTARLVLEGSSFSDPQSLVNDRQAELTAAFADPVTAELFVARSVEFGSTTVSSSTRVVLGEPEYGTDIEVEFSSFSPTSVPTSVKSKKSSSASSSAPSSQATAVYIVVVVAAVLMSGLVGFVLSRKKWGVASKNGGWDSVVKAADYSDVGSAMDSLGRLDEPADMEMVAVDLDYEEEAL